jgi:hypothetical protein
VTYAGCPGAPPSIGGLFGGVARVNCQLPFGTPIPFSSSASAIPEIRLLGTGPVWMRPHSYHHDELPKSISHAGHAGHRNLAH